jgi:hypothetical protein
MLKKVMCLTICGLMLASSAFAVSGAVLDKRANEIGKVNKYKCLMLASISVTAYKQGIELSKVSYEGWLKRGLRDLSKLNEKLDSNEVVTYSSDDIDKTEEILTKLYNSGVEDRVKHGWKPRLFNMTINSLPRQIGEECVMQNLYE